MKKDSKNIGLFLAVITLDRADVYFSCAHPFSFYTTDAYTCTCCIYVHVDT